MAALEAGRPEAARRPALAGARLRYPLAGTAEWRPAKQPVVKALAVERLGAKRLGAKRLGA
ncbi:MAG: hypothetical protein ACERIE_07650, partial [Methyloceanibacter sp.]